MLSIDNTYDENELRQYGQRVAKLLPGEKIEWVVELKIDGVAVSLTYENGRLVQGATARQRPGGRRRDPQHAHRARRAPAARAANRRRLFEVRGEIYITNSDLVAINQQQQAAGLPLFANSRNCAAGAIRLLDPRIAPSGGCGCFATASARPRD